VRVRRALSSLGLVGGLTLVACGSSRHDDGEGTGAHGGTSPGGRAAGGFSGAAGSAGNATSGRGGSAATAGVGGSSGAGTVAGATGGGTAGASSGVGGTSAGTAGQGSAGLIGEAGSAGASGDAGAGGEGPVLPTRGGGQVTVAVIANRHQTSQFTQTTASFWDPSLPAPSSCTRETFGPCTVSTCPVASSSDPAPPSKNPDAGQITLESTPVSYSKDLYPDGRGAYAGDVVTTLLWAGGEALSVKAEGGEVPAFELTTAAPLPLVVERADLPPDTEDGFLPYDATQDLVLEFSNGKPGVSIQVSGSSGFGNDATSTNMYCFFDSAPGTLTISSAALAALATMYSPVIYLYTLGRTDVSVGNYDVAVIFGMPMNDSDGNQLAFATH
jgi:hypothetical protein